MLHSKRDKSQHQKLLMPSTLLPQNYLPSNLKVMLKPSLLNYTESEVKIQSLPSFHLLQHSQLKNYNQSKRRLLN